MQIFIKFNMFYVWLFLCPRQTSSIIIYLLEVKIIYNITRETLYKNVYKINNFNNMSWNFDESLYSFIINNQIGKTEIHFPFYIFPEKNIQLCWTFMYLVVFFNSFHIFENVHEFLVHYKARVAQWVRYSWIT